MHWQVSVDLSRKFNIILNGKVKFKNYFIDHRVVALLCECHNTQKDRTENSSSSESRSSSSDKHAGASFSSSWSHFSSLLSSGTEEIASRFTLGRPDSGTSNHWSWALPSRLRHETILCPTPVTRFTTEVTQKFTRVEECTFHMISKKRIPVILSMHS